MKAKSETRQLKMVLHMLVADWAQGMSVTITIKGKKLQKIIKT